MIDCGMDPAREAAATCKKPLQVHHRKKCDCSECEEQATHQCENCGRYFCLEHGTGGGDRQVQEVGAVAYPNQCWICEATV